MNLQQLRQGPRLAAGFGAVSAYAGWAGLPLYDAEEWVVYVAER